MQGVLFIYVKYEVYVLSGVYPVFRIEVGF
jgi:hypothetical protein